MFRRRRPREYSKAQIISAAVDDARAQDELAALTKEAVAFICEVVDRARAIEETLPRAYFVLSGKNGLTLCQNLRDTRHWLSDELGRDELLVAIVKDETVDLIECTFFIEDIRNGLLNEIGRFIIERSRANRERVQEMHEAVSDVKALRQMLDDESAW